MKRKVLLDLFASPGTVIPVVVGLTSLMVSWAMGGDPVATATGIFGLLGGAGYASTRWILGLDEITRRAYEEVIEKHQEEQDQVLDQLERQLRRDNDSRTEGCLRDLRELYDAFRQSSADTKAAAVRYQLMGQVEEVFQASVRQLRRSLELHQIGQKLSGPARNEVADERERVIREVLETRDHLSTTIEQFHAFSTRRGESELSRLREELDQTLRVAKKTEERMSEFGTRQPDYDVSEFE